MSADDPGRIQASATETLFLHLQPLGDNNRSEKTIRREPSGVLRAAPKS